MFFGRRAAELRDKGQKAEEAEAKAVATKLRVGSYVIDQGTQRPFVYEDEDARGSRRSDTGKGSE